MLKGRKTFSVRLKYPCDAALSHTLFVDIFRLITLYLCLAAPPLWCFQCMQCETFHEEMAQRHNL